MKPYTLRTSPQGANARSTHARVTSIDPAPSRKANDTLFSKVSRSTTGGGQGKTTMDAESGFGIPTINRRRNEVPLSTQGRTADVEWTRAEWTALCKRLQNGNGDRRFVMGFRKHGLKQYVRSKRVPVDKAISWAWD